MRTSADQTRFAVNIDYVLGWLRQEENQYLSYALGYVDGGRSPLELVRPRADRPAGGPSTGHSFGNL